MNKIQITMTTQNIPEGYNTVMPYLIVKNAEQFLKFTKGVFGATEKMKALREDGKTIMHGEILIGESCIMFAEATEQFAVQNAGMFINVADADATYQKALENGATSVMEPADQDYGRSGGIIDPCGNTWWMTSNK